MRVDVKDVEAGLRTADILDRYVGSYRGRREIRLAECPRCHARPRRRSVVVNAETGKWIHHGGAEDDARCSGGPLDLVAAFEGLDRKRDFQKLLDIAAPIAGVLPGMDDIEREQRIADRRRELEAYEAALQAKETEARLEVPGRWALLSRRSADGERYLAGRGIAPAELVARDVVRFAGNGDPVVRLFAFDSCEPINLITRHIHGSQKSDSLEWCSTEGTIAGRVNEIDPEGIDVAVIAEGMTDALAAVLAFPGCAVLGANGAGRMEAVAEAVVPRLVAARGWLLVSADDDATGIKNGAKACSVAVDAGMRFDRDLHVLELRGHPDLADAYAAGWRWTWPS